MPEALSVAADFYNSSLMPSASSSSSSSSSSLGFGGATCGEGKGEGDGGGVSEGEAEGLSIGAWSGTAASPCTRRRSARTLWS